MAHLSGTSTGNLSGLTYSHGGGLGGFGGKTKQQTQLAAITAPPRPPSFTNAVVIIGGIFIFLFFCKSAQNGLLGLLILIGGAVGLYFLRNKSYQAEKAQYQEAIEIWRRSTICLRCGHTWMIY